MTYILYRHIGFIFLADLDFFLLIYFLMQIIYIQEKERNNICVSTNFYPKYHLIELNMIEIKSLK
jgi:hypothetical protein